MTSNQAITGPSSVRRSLDEARRAIEDLGDMIGPLKRSFEQAVGDHPIRAVVLSLATGVFLGWLIKR